MFLFTNDYIYEVLLYNDIDWKYQIYNKYINPIIDQNTYVYNFISVTKNFLFVLANHKKDDQNIYVFDRRSQYLDEG